jgi:hypothetical protein
MSSFFTPRQKTTNFYARLVAVMIWVLFSPLILAYAILKFALHDNFMLGVLIVINIFIFLLWPSLFWLTLNLFLITLFLSLKNYRSLSFRTNISTFIVLFALSFTAGNFLTLTLSKQSVSNLENLGQVVESANLPKPNGNVDTQANELAVLNPMSLTNAEKQNEPSVPASTNKNTSSSTNSKLSSVQPVTYRFDPNSLLCYSSDSAVYSGLNSDTYTTLDDCNWQITQIQKANLDQTENTSSPDLTIPASVDNNKETLRKPSAPILFKPTDLNATKAKDNLDNVKPGSSEVSKPSQTVKNQD